MRLKSSRLLFLGIAFFAIVFTANATNNLAAKTACKNWIDLQMNEKDWAIGYTGFGQLKFNQGVELEPRAIASEPGTHAALALTKLEKKYKDFVVKVKYENVRGLRSPASNTWEVFWLFFNYNKTSTGKTTNYFIFKPNGVELGKAWNELDQAFLWTSNKPQALFGETYDLELVKKNQTVKAYINGQLVMDYKGESNGAGGNARARVGDHLGSAKESHSKETLYDSPGQIGLYTEDAKVHVKSFSICQL